MPKSQAATPPFYLLLKTIESTCLKIQHIEQGLLGTTPAAVLRGKPGHNELLAMVKGVNSQLNEVKQAAQKLELRFANAPPPPCPQITEIQKALSWVVSNTNGEHYRSVMLMADEFIHNYETTDYTLDQAYEALLSNRSAMRVMIELFCLYHTLQIDCAGAYDLDYWLLRAEEMPEQIAQCFLAEELENGLDDDEDGQ